MGWLKSFTRKVGNTINTVRTIASRAYSSKTEAKEATAEISDDAWAKEMQRQHYEEMGRTPENLSAQSYPRPRTSLALRDIYEGFNSLEAMIDVAERRKMKEIALQSLRDIVYGNFNGTEDSDMLGKLGEAYSEKLEQNRNKTIRYENDLHIYPLLRQSNKKELMTLEALAKMRATYAKNDTRKSFDVYLIGLLETDSNFYEESVKGDIKVLNHDDSGRIKYEKDNNEEDAAFITDYGTVHSRMLYGALSTDGQIALNHLIAKKRMENKKKLAGCMAANCSAGL